MGKFLALLKIKSCDQWEISIDTTSHLASKNNASRSFPVNPPFNECIKSNLFSDYLRFTVTAGHPFCCQTFPSGPRTCKGIHLMHDPLAGISAQQYKLWKHEQIPNNMLKRNEREPWKVEATLPFSEGRRVHSVHVWCLDANGPRHLEQSQRHKDTAQCD